MEAGIPARLTAAEGRKFGLTVGIAFLVLAGLSRWRGHEVPPVILAVLGGSLLLGGLLLPGHLSGVHRAWMGLALAISKVTTPIFMGLVYFLGFVPLGVTRRMMGKNALLPVVTRDGYWARREPSQQRSDLQRQF